MSIDLEVLKVAIKLRPTSAAGRWTLCVVCGEPTIFTWAHQAPGKDCWATIPNRGYVTARLNPRFDLTEEEEKLLPPELEWVIKTHRSK